MEKQEEEISMDAKSKSSDLVAWSSRVEDFLDGGDVDGAVDFLKKVIESLLRSDGPDANLGLAAAYNDLGGIYASQGLSLKSDECFTSALLIKQRASQISAEEILDSWEQVATLSLETSCNDRGKIGDGKVSQGTEDHHKHQNLGDLNSASSSLSREEEEDWESASVELPSFKAPTTSGLQQTTRQDAVDAKEIAKHKQQRGRGSFTYGEVVSLDIGADHVLVISGFSPKLKTNDFETLVKPFSMKGGCTLRWIDDTTILAVFRTPDVARQALATINDPRFKIEVYGESSHAYGLASEKDLQPPAQRPVSSARVAQRMIAGALNQPGLRTSLLSKGRSNMQEVKQQEKERRARLQNRAQRREEAWGDDD